MRPGTSSPSRAGPKSGPERLSVVGVRHHSPACARLVDRVIREKRPAFVLIEGPADFNPHLADLRLAHDLPLAIFSFHAAGDSSKASYSPFCAYSPEWRALRGAWRVGAEPLFCDLPAWHADFGERANRYADPHGERSAAAEKALAEAMGEDGLDALWDALAEQAPAGELAERLDRYFHLLRPDGAEDPAEAARERFMARTTAWALKKAGRREVVLVCGGWHAEAVRRLALAADGEKPVLPEPGARTGSYLVPYDYRRLDRFTGYAAGMPSPAYYEQVYGCGLAAAADWAANEIAAGLRRLGQVVSTADRVAWQSHAEALARLRGHAAVLRADLLDAALATLVKEGLEERPAWEAADRLGPTVHPALAAMLAALTGTRRGRLAEGTRMPPLLADVERRLEELEVETDPAGRRLTLDWHDERDRARAHVLHALVILDVPGVERLAGPARAEAGAPREEFRLADHADRMGVLIEASAWGGTLPMAAAARVAARAAQAAGDMSELAACLSDALFAGILAESEDLPAQLERGLSRARTLDELGPAGGAVVRLHRFGDLFGSDAHHALGRLARAVFARALWLVEGVGHGASGTQGIEAVLACRDLMRDCPGLDLPADDFVAALGRCVAAPDSAPTLAGAALGCLIACDRAEVEGAADRLRRFSRADQLGDFLGGLFALARETIAAHEPLITAVNALVSGWTDDEFLMALPSLRQAFAWFPPRERERLARSVLTAHGYGAAEADMAALGWMRQSRSVADQAGALALEAAARKRLEISGLKFAE